MRKLEPEEIDQKLHMIRIELQKVNEELLNPSEETQLKEEGVRQDKIYLKLKLTLEKIDQELQEIILQGVNLRILARVLQLIEESLQVLQNKEGRPREELKRDLRKAQRELRKWRYPFRLDSTHWFFRQLRIISMTVEECLNSLDQVLNLPVIKDLKKLCTKIKDDLILLECAHELDDDHMIPEAHELLNEVSYALKVNIKKKRLHMAS